MDGGPDSVSELSSFSDLLPLHAAALLAVVNLTLVLVFWKGCMRQLFQN